MLREEPISSCYENENLKPKPIEYKYNGLSCSINKNLKKTKHYANETVNQYNINSLQRPQQQPTQFTEKDVSIRHILIKSNLWTNKSRRMKFDAVQKNVCQPFLVFNIRSKKLQISHLLIISPQLIPKVIGGDNPENRKAMRAMAQILRQKEMQESIDKVVHFGNCTVENLAHLMNIFTTLLDTLGYQLVTVSSPLLEGEDSATLSFQQSMSFPNTKHKPVDLFQIWGSTVSRDSLSIFKGASELINPLPPTISYSKTIHIHPKEERSKAKCLINNDELVIPLPSQLEQTNGSDHEPSSQTECDLGTNHTYANLTSNDTNYASNLENECLKSPLHIFYGNTSVIPSTCQSAEDSSDLSPCSSLQLDNLPQLEHQASSESGVSCPDASSQSLSSNHREDSSSSWTSSTTTSQSPSQLPSPTLSLPSSIPLAVGIQENYQMSSDSEQEEPFMPSVEECNSLHSEIIVVNNPHLLPLELEQTTSDSDLIA